MSIRTVLERLGASGMSAVVLIVLTGAFSITAVRPLESHSARLTHELRTRFMPAAADVRVSSHTPATQLDAFYKFFDRKEPLDQWLAKLYAIASARGLELKTGNYQLDDSRRRIQRYQITLPITGTYSELRSFIDAALVEIPVLSLDHVSFRRKSFNDPRAEAEMTFTVFVARK